MRRSKRQFNHLTDLSGKLVQRVTITLPNLSHTTTSQGSRRISLERKRQLVDRPKSKLQGRTGVLLRVREAGLFGTDREIGAFEFGTLPRV